MLVVNVSTVDAQISAHGKNVKWLSHTAPQGGNVIGKFYQNGNGRWTEEASDGPHALTERQRSA